jgi:hypothetical protein
MKFSRLALVLMFIGATGARAQELSSAHQAIIKTYVAQSEPALGPNAPVTGASFCGGGGSAATPSIVPNCADNDTGIFSNSANILELSAGGFSGLRVDSNRFIYGGTSANPVTINAGASSTVPLVVRGTSGQSANLQEWNVSGGAAVASVSAAGAGSFASVTSVGKFVSLNGITTDTATPGVAPIVKYGEVLAGTSNAVTVATVTPSADTIYEVGGFITASAYTSGNVALELDYNDCATNTARAQNLYGTTGAGTNANVLTAVGVLACNTVTICAKASTAVTAKTIDSLVATASWYAHIKQIK